MADVFGLAEELHSPPADFGDHCRRIISRMVVDHLDLHVFRPWVLHQHTRERFAQVARAVIGRNHDRPGRPWQAVADWGNSRPVGRSAYAVFAHRHWFLTSIP